MVKLRLRRKGRIHHPVYDIVAVDGHARRDSDFIERLGFFDPNTQPSTISINPDRAIYWLNVGAQPTDVVKRILSYEGVLLRRHLAFKGKNQTEIEELISKHKDNSLKRFHRLKQVRKKRDAARAKAKAQEQEQAAAQS